MKKKLLLTLIAVLTTALPSLAYDFEVDGIYYNITSLQNLTCAVTYKEKVTDFSEYVYTTSYSSPYKGALVIPASVTYGESTYTVTKVGSFAFCDCAELWSVEIPNTVTSIGECAFARAWGLTSVQIPNSVTEIEDYAFYECSLNSVAIPNSVTSIGEGAFSFCYGLTTVVIPNSVTEIGDGLFAGCENLTSAVIGVSVKKIGKKTFSFCRNMTWVDLPNSVTEIGDSAFYDCSSLKSMTIPNSVTKTGISVFDDCSSLKSVEIGNSLTSIGDWTFHGCSSLTSIEIPNSVKTIGYGAFNRCTSLTSVEIPYSVTSIGGSAFSGCASLTSVTIPNFITSIGIYAFYYCSSLTSIEIPNSVTSIGNYSFQLCSSLKSVIIGNSVATIGEKAFQSCTELKDITSLAVTPPSIKSNTFSTTKALLKVPEESVDAYKSADYWSQFSNIVSLSGSESGEDPEIKQCATPTITLADGKLVVTSETEGSTCYTLIESDDFKGIDTNDPIELTGTYNISAYAHAEGYTNSETATATLVWIAPDDMPDDIICMEAKKPVVIRSLDGSIIISGTTTSEKIQLYTNAGLLIATVAASSDQTIIPHSLAKGEVVIVKYGNRSIKITI